MTNHTQSPTKATVMLEIDENGVIAGIHTTHPIRIILRNKPADRLPVWSVEDIVPAKKSPMGQHYVDLSHLITKIPNGFQFTTDNVTWRTDTTSNGWQAFDANNNKLPFNTPDKNAPTPEDIDAAATYIQYGDATKAG